jgi:hypothetical protein
MLAEADPAKIVDTVHTLDRMAYILARPTSWTRGGSARDAHGGKTSPAGPDAVAWDLCGALFAASGPLAPFDTSGQRANLVVAALFAVTRAPLIAWNDDPARTHRDVLNLLYDAAQRLEQRLEGTLDEMTHREAAE